MVEADREVRVLDKLEERQRRRAPRAARKQPKPNVLDEIAATRWEGD